MNRKTGILLLCAVFILGVTRPAAAESSRQSYISLGEDLTEQERAKVLDLLGVTEFDLLNYQIITVTNEEEHKYLGNYLDEAVIGDRALSSVKVSGENVYGIWIACYNIDYCTEGMYRNALLTAGVQNADVVIAGPFSISGTAALVGIIRAYEVMTGQPLPEANIDAANHELVVSAQIADHVGDSNRIEQLFAIVKSEVLQTDSADDSQIQGMIENAASQLGLNLCKDDKDSISSVMEEIEGLNLDAVQIQEQAGDLYQELEDMGIQFDSGQQQEQNQDYVGNFFHGMWEYATGEW